jgi:WD40 repeat protein
MWDLAKKKRKRLEGHDDSAVWAMVVDPNSGTIAAGGQQGIVVRWSADGTLLGKRGINHNGEVGGIAVAADRVYTCADNVIEWNLATGEALREFARGKKQDYSLNDIALTGTMLYATGMDGCAAWDLSSGEQRWHTKLERSERVILDGDKLMLGSGDELTWLDAATGKIIGKAFDTGNVLYQLIPLTKDRVAIADFLGDHCMQIWTRDGKRLPDLELNITDTHGIYSAAGSRDGATLYISCADETIRVYDTATWQLKREYHGEYTSDRVAVSPSQTVVAGSMGKGVELFDAVTFDKRGEISVGDSIERLVFVDDNRLLCGLEGGGVTCVSW